MERILRVLVPVVLVVSAACAQPEAEPAPTTAAGESAPIVERAPITDKPRVVFLGDSLTAGYGLDRDESVPSLIQKRLEQHGYPHQVVNAGVSGDTSAGGLSRLDWSLEGDVEVLIVELGANDGLRGLPVASLKRNLTEVITRAKARGISVVLTGMEAPPNFGAAYTSEFREVYTQLAREHEVTFVPFYLEGVAGIPRLNLADGIHPNAAGSRIIEKTIWSALAPLLANRRAGHKTPSR